VICLGCLADDAVLCTLSCLSLVRNRRQVLSPAENYWGRLSRSHDLLSVCSHVWCFPQRGLCIARGTADCINFTVVITILPVCKTLNKVIHKLLSKVSVRLLAFYLEKLKVFHQCLAVTLVFASGM
jgi:hypothetical protein